jgi:hypothetical protein
LTLLQQLWGPAKGFKQRKQRLTLLRNVITGPELAQDSINSHCLWCFFCGRMVCDAGHNEHPKAHVQLEGHSVSS